MARFAGGLPDGLLRWLQTPDAAVDWLQLVTRIHGFQRRTGLLGAEEWDEDYGSRVLFVALGDTGAELAALAAQATLGDGNLMPGGVPFARPRVIRPYRARCCRIADPIGFFVSW